MKTNSIALNTCILAVCMMASSRALAQQPQLIKPESFAYQMKGGNTFANYTYRVFEAPNKMFGYDIFLNGKIISHQAASIVQSEGSGAALAKKGKAEKAALMSIEKLKKGALATLREEEIKKL